MKIDVRLLRERSGLNGTEFWQAVGVTQSGGSRYENGRRVPKPVLELLRLVYVEKIDLKSVRKEDVMLVAYMKEKHKPLYQKLRREAAQHARMQ